MAQPICVVTDSSCDLPAETVRELGIEVVPLTVSFGAETFVDGELSAEEFWARARGPRPPLTSQPSVGDFVAVFQRLMAEGRQALCVTITSKHSGTFSVARLAGEEFGGSARILDSLSTSLGLGYQVIQAALAARAGQAMEQIVHRLEELRGRTHIWIVLDTLEYVRRGGRADGFIPLLDRMTRMLNIKALISMIEGELRMNGAARSLRGALERVQAAVEGLGPLEALAVMHSRNVAMAEQMADTLAQRLGFPRERIWVRETGVALASHAGPGMVAVMAVPAARKD